MSRTPLNTDVERIADAGAVSTIQPLAQAISQVVKTKNNAPRRAAASRFRHSNHHPPPAPRCRVAERPERAPPRRASIQWAVDLVGIRMSQPHGPPGTGGRHG